MRDFLTVLAAADSWASSAQQLITERERRREGSWKRGRRDTKREKNKKHWEERGCSRNSRKVFVLAFIEK